MTISDVIRAKERIMARYESNEYLDQEIAKGRTYTSIIIGNLDRNLALSELIIELSKQPTNPVNIEIES